MAEPKPQAPRRAKPAARKTSTRKAPSPKTPAIAPGAILRGRFELIAEVARGGLSHVYQARDLVAADAGFANPVVALKIVVADTGSDPDLIALMHREARRLRDLVHPNIVRVYDMDTEGKAHFMVMEYLEGQSLAKALRRAEGHKLDPSQVARLVTDIAAALSFAHSKGIVHADLKPGNVFVERSGRAKLIDFNIAYPVARPAKEGEEDTVQILGRLGAVTPLYASPQRLAGAEPSEGDDVYSLAVLTYVSLTGERPFGDRNAREAVEQGLVPAPPEGLARSRWNALRKGLALDDAQRTASAERFAAEFAGGRTFPWPLERITTSRNR
jgi:serine/threonine protein kinase